MLGERIVSGTLVASSKLQSFMISQTNSEVHVVPIKIHKILGSTDFYINFYKRIIAIKKATGT